MAKNLYPPADVTVALLLESARNAVRENPNYSHPEDIATAMINAIEVSWPVVLSAHNYYRSNNGDN